MGEAWPGVVVGNEAATAPDREVPDERLAVAARSDAAAFARLYRRHVDGVFRYCQRRLGTREAAEDVTSLVFERALTRLHTFRGGSFRAWLYTIAHHAVVDALRARPRPGYHPAMLDLPDPRPSPEAEALAGETVRTLRDALARLSPDQRDVLELHLSGLRGREIAEVLGRRHDAVRAIQSRAVARLRAILMEPGSEEVCHDRR